MDHNAEFIEFILTKAEKDFVYTHESAYRKDSSNIINVIPRLERSLQHVGTNIAYHNRNARTTAFYKEGRLIINPAIPISNKGLVNKDLTHKDLLYSDLTKVKKTLFKETLKEVIYKREFGSTKGIIPLVLRSQLHFYFDGWRLHIL